VFDNLSAFIQPKNVDSNPVFLARPLLQAVQHHEVALRQDPFEGHALAGVASMHFLEIGDETILSVAYVRIVLDVGFTHIAGDYLGGARLVERHVVEGHYRLFVVLDVGHWLYRPAASIDRPLARRYAHGS
jgi:hypothetical protein